MLTGSTCHSVGQARAGTASCGFIAASAPGRFETFFVLSYLAFSVPAILAGVMAGRLGLQAASIGYGLLLVALGCVALAMMARQKTAG